MNVTNMKIGSDKAKKLIYENFGNIFESN